MQYNILQYNAVQCSAAQPKTTEANCNIVKSYRHKRKYRTIPLIRKDYTVYGKIEKMNPIVAGSSLLAKER